MRDALVGGSRVAVVGAGAAGLATARQLRAVGLEPVVFDAAPRPGGVWTADASPIYAGLRTNLPVDLMAFRDHPFPPGTPRFATPAVIAAYLVDYTERHDLGPCLRLGRAVHEVAPEADGWRVSAGGEVGRYPAVVVASGHYRTPRQPQLPGADESRIGQLHSREYRVPAPFAGQRVVLLGARASGVDIALELADVGADVTLTGRGLSAGKRLGPAGAVRCRPAVVALAGPRGVRLADDSRLDDVDWLIYCTGYHYTFEFLAPGLIEVDDDWVHPLHLDLFAAREPDLAFVGLPFQVVPFPLFELQAAVVAARLTGALELPPSAAMIEDAQAQARERITAGVQRRHLLRYGDAQFAYLDQLAALLGRPPLPTEFAALYRQTRAARQASPHDYRDRPLPDVC